MKRLMKRGILLLLALAVLVVCVGCGDDAETLIQRGVEAEEAEDYEQARQCYEQAAKKGSSDGTFRLGELYQAGHIEGGFEKAQECFEEAAKKQHPMASFYIASYYETGLGGTQDDEKALRYYEQAVALGVPNLEGKVAELQTKLNA